MKSILLFWLAGVLSLVITFRAYGQKRELDSLDRLIHKARSDSAKIRLITAKIDIISTYHLDSAIMMGLKTLNDASRLGLYKQELAIRQKLIFNYSYKGNYPAALEQIRFLEKFIRPAVDSVDFASLYSSKGLVYSMQSQFDTAIRFYEKAIRILERFGNREKLSTIYINASIPYQQQSNYPMSLKYMQKALKISEEDNDLAGQAYVYVNMANAYANIGDAERAEKAYLKTIDLAKKTELKNVELYAWNNLSSHYIDLMQWQKGYKCALKAAELGRHMGDQGIQAASFAKASKTMVHLKQFDRAAEYAQKAMALADSSGQVYNISQAYSSMGFVYLARNQFPEAIPYYEKSLASLEDADLYSPYYARLYDELSQCYEKTGNFANALNAYRQFAMITDSIRNRENIQKTTEQTMNFEFEKKEQSLKAQQDAKDAVTRARQTALIVGLALSFLLIAGASFGYYQKQKAEKLLLKQKIQLESTLDELTSTQALLIQTEKMASLGELTTGIAHEIQNPLNFINNFSEVSQEMISEIEEETAKDPAERDDALIREILADIRKSLEKVQHHGKRADSIIKGMLAHSRTGSGIKESTDINALVDEYLRLAYHGMRSKDNSFNATLQSALDENIGNLNIISQDIGRVLLNLINNALYAIGEKNKLFGENPSVLGNNIEQKKYEPTLSVSTKKLPDKVEITVKDNGTGIPAHVIDKIFQPFFTTKPTGQGTGLGLSLSYDIIKAHGGELKVETTEGEGTEFTVVLPG